MNIDQNVHENPEQQTAGEPCCATAAAKNILERGSEVYGQVEQAVSDLYDKTTRKVGETYKKAQNYTSENPGQTIIVALGIGVGLGFLLSSLTRR